MATRSHLPLSQCLVCGEWLFIGVLPGDTGQVPHRHEGHPDSCYAADGALRPDYEAVVGRALQRLMPPEARPS